MTDPQNSLLPGESTTGTVSEWFCFAHSSNSFHPASGWHPFPAISCSFYLRGAKKLILSTCQIRMSNFSPFHFLNAERNMFNMISMKIQTGLLIKLFRLQSKLQHLWKKKITRVVFLKNVIQKSLASASVFWWHWNRASGPNSLLARVGVTPPEFLVPVVNATVGVWAGKQTYILTQSFSTWHGCWAQKSYSSPSEMFLMLNHTTLLFRTFFLLSQSSHGM